jgi:hypothetical protein
MAGGEAMAELEAGIEGQIAATDAERAQTA